MVRAMLTAAVLVLPLGACAQIQTAWEVATAASQVEVSGQTVVVAIQAFDGAQVLATNYLRLPRCTSANRPICREPSARPIIKGAIYSGREARNNLKALLRSNAGKSIPVGNYNTLIAATNTIRDATAAYRAATNQ